MEDARFPNWTKLDGFSEGVAFLEEVFIMGLLVAVGANVDAEIFVGFMCFVDGNGDSRGVG